MANTAFGHDATLTTPGSTTDTALVRWANTSGTSLNNTINILSDGSNITLNARGEVRFSDADSTHYIAFESPATVSTSYTMTLPADLPAADEVLTVTSYSSGAGVLEWAAAGGGSITALSGNAENRIPAFGSTTTVLDGNAGLTYDATKMIVTHPSSGDAIEVKSTGSNSNAQFRITNDARSWDFQVRGDRSDSLYIVDVTAGDLSGLEQRIRIDTSGAVSMPAQPAFFAQVGTVISNVTGAGTTYIIVFQSEIFDQNSDFDGSSTFTAPVTGRYFFWGFVSLENVTAASTNGQMTFNASNRIGYSMTPTAHHNSGNVMPDASTFLDMDANDTCTLGMRAYGESSNIIDINPGTYFSGYLVV